MNEYRVEIKVKNNMLYQKMINSGCKTISELSKRSGVSSAAICAYLNFKIAPLTKDGVFRKSVLDLADFFKCMPEELFSSTHLETVLESNVRIKEISEAEAKFLLFQEAPEALLIDEIVSQEDKVLSLNWIEDVIPTLTRREEEIIRMRFGLAPYTREYNLGEISSHMGFSIERIRQQQNKALRKLRHPSRSREALALKSKERINNAV